MLEIVLTHFQKIQSNFGLPNDPNWLEIVKTSGLINAQKFMKLIMGESVTFRYRNQSTFRMRFLKIDHWDE